MPRGPKGEKRPADVIGNAVRVMQIAVGEHTDPLPFSPIACLPRRMLLRAGAFGQDPAGL